MPPGAKRKGACVRLTVWLARIMYMFDIAALFLTFLAIRERCKVVFSRKKYANKSHIQRLRSSLSESPNFIHRARIKIGLDMGNFTILELEIV